MIQRRAMATGSAGDERSKLDSFDGSDPGAYRLWKRRARLMLAGLPSTVNERKYGARLMEFVKGEAETLLETIDIDVLTKEGGDKAIFAMLDEKYLPQPRDLLQSALKGFFYDLTVKGGESYAQFYARFDAALRKLKEQDIDLPEIVKGFMLIKKLKLESQQESMILTTTGGDMELKKVVEAVKNVFPEGKGSTRSGKEVFMAETEKQNIISEASGSRDMVENEVFEVAEIVTDPYQDSGDEEEALEVFESYAQVRRKLQERRKDRGFSGGRIGDDGQQWKLQGTVRGRLELLKAKTKCHLCRKTGHWKRECPERHSKGVKPAKTEKEVHVADAYQTEVLVVNDREKQDGEIWSMFQERAVKATHWKTSVDVQQDGNADTHATGNQQILLSEMQFQPNFTAACPESPAPESFRHFADIDEFEVFVNEPHPGVEVLSAQPDVGTCESVDSILGQCAVPDTACRRSLIGEYTLGMLERHLRSQGYRVIRRRGKSEFKFGNNETLISWEDALIPACIGGNHVIVRVAVLPLGGSRTPLLLSKEFLRQMNVVIDTSDDTVLFKGFGVKMKLKETARGHYAIPMFDMSGRDCFVVAVDECDECDEKKKKREHRFDISQLEKTERQVVEEPAIHRDSADPCDHVLRSEHGGQQQSDGAADDGQCGVQGWHESAAWRCDRTGQHSRSGNGRRGRYDSKQLCANRREVPQKQASLVGGPDLRDGQGLLQMGEESHIPDLIDGDAETQHLHQQQRRSQEVAHRDGGQDQSGAGEAQDEGSTGTSEHAEDLQDEVGRKPGAVHEGGSMVHGVFGVRREPRADEGAMEAHDPTASSPGEHSMQGHADALGADGQGEACQIHDGHHSPLESPDRAELAAKELYGRSVQSVTRGLKKK